MFCFQCQETAKNQGCTINGMCGKKGSTAELQDLLIYNLKGIAVLAQQAKKAGVDVSDSYGRFIAEGLFTTITNVNFNDEDLVDWITRAQTVKKTLFDAVKDKVGSDLHDSATWFSQDASTFQAKAKKIGVLSTENEDVRSLRELLVIGLKGICAYADHAAVLGVTKDEIWDFLYEALDSTTQDLSVDQMVAMVMKAGETAVTTMAALDQANTQAYGNPEITQVNIGVGTHPGILISGHDLKDMEELLEQTKGTGVDVYTHGEMLPANCYPAFKKYDHLKGNYGGSWWHQNEDFETFNGPVLMTTNCIIPIKKKNTYQDKVFTTGVVSYPGTTHIPEGKTGGPKIFQNWWHWQKPVSPPLKLKPARLLAVLPTIRFWPLQTRS